MTKESRVLKYSHRVSIGEANNHLVVEWKNFFGQYNQLIAEDIEDLDILIVELAQAIYNYRESKAKKKKL